MSVYRSAEIKGLIAPDHRWRNAVLLLFGGMISGVVLTLIAPIVAESVSEEAIRAPRLARNTRTMIDARARTRSHAMGSLTVVCQPKCSSIIDNGEDLGPGHLFHRPVPAGDHRLLLHAPNGVAKAVSVDVVPEETRELRVNME